MFGSFKIFYEMELRDYLSNNDDKIRAEIERESENHILNVNETDYIDYLTNKFTINFPVLDFDNLFADSYDKMIPAERFPHGFNVNRGVGESYSKPVIVYHIPFTGNGNLLKYTPNTRLMRTTPVTIKDQCICFEIINFRDNPSEIKSQADDILSLLKRQEVNFQNDMLSYNSDLKRTIEHLFKSRKEKILRKNETLGSLGVPIKKKNDLPETYSIPKPEFRKSVNVKPKVTEEGFKPEPTLDYDTYFEILQTIFDVGKVFERYPSTYHDKGEEDLRDHLLLYLEPRFEGSATGETFNKSGKTDILIRHENSNVFIAECKFWRGQKSYLDAITQLFNYLTFRDSKAAVILFVDNKDISPVLKTVKEETPNHSNYLGFVNDQNDSWFNYRFHINDDPNREVKLAVLIFHIPK